MLNSVAGAAERPAASTVRIAWRSNESDSFVGPSQLVRPGQMLFCEGDVGAEVFHIISGTVRFSSVSAEGRRLIAGFAVAGEIFSLSHNNRYAFTAEAVSDCSFRRLPRAAASRFPAGPLGQKIADHLLDEPWRLQLELLKLLHKSADEAIAYFVNNIGSRLNRNLTNGSTVKLDMSRSDIADYLGLTVETVCRGITRLIKEGMLSAKAPHDLVIRDIHALRVRARGTERADKIDTLRAEARRAS
jgi:CRP/FNR family transcriptional regulator, anaerobic regulatory protein